MNGEYQLRYLQLWYEDYSQRYLSKPTCDVYAHFRQSEKSPDPRIEFESPKRIVHQKHDRKEQHDPFGCSPRRSTVNNSETYAYTDEDVREIVSAYDDYIFERHVPSVSGAESNNVPFSNNEPAPLIENGNYLHQCSLEMKEADRLDVDDTHEDDSDVQEDLSDQDEEEVDDGLSQDIKSYAKEGYQKMEQSDLAKYEDVQPCWD